MTTRRRGDAPARETSAPCLLRLVDYEHPRTAGSLHVLAAVDQVELGRGESTSVSRAGRTLALSIADKRMSQCHAKLVREGAVWTLEDLGSRNGTYVDGAPITRRAIAPGMLFEVGRQLFLLATTEPGARLDVEAAQLDDVLPGIRTFSSRFAGVLRAALRLARSATNLVLHGETGVGKEVVARGIHGASGRSGAFVAVNCAALPPNLVESELFGFKKGAFSGANEDRLGLVRASHGGTLFLDEIAELPPLTQTALLRVLQEREVLPIGATRAIEVDLRVVAASHRDLEAAVRDGSFREDLLARLAGYVIDLPPLRERREDFGLILASLLERLGEPGAATKLAPDAGLALASYGWPRNVRELEQALGAAVALAAEGTIELEHLPKPLRSRPSGPAVGGRSEPIDRPSEAALESPADEDFSPSELRRREQLRAALVTHRGNIAAVARELGVARMQIHRWLSRYQIAIEDFRGDDRDG